jgi:hypothetical protein
MKLKLNILFVMIFISLFLLSCDEATPTAESKQTEQTNQILNEINRQIGLPNIVNFQQKKLMKRIMEECDKENLICFAYLKADYTGQLVFIGKCVGYGVPFSAQYTNPQKRDWYSNQGGVGYLPQADPNGLYMPISSSATWLLMIDKENKPRVVYIEPEIVVSPFPLH